MSNLNFIIVSLITIQMIFSPVIFAQTTEDASFVAEKLQCEQDPAKTWDRETNRCVFSQQAMSVRSSYLDCAERPEEEQDACITEYAESQVEFEANRAAGWGFADGATDVVYALGMGFTLMAYVGKGAPGGCTSRTIYTLGSVGALGYELYQYFGLSGKLKDLNGQFNKKENIYNSQLEAFNYLKNEQNTISDISKQKAWFYTGIGAIFAVAAIVGYYETATGTGCNASSEGESEGDPPPEQPEINEEFDSDLINNGGSMIVPPNFPKHFVTIEDLIFQIKEKEMKNRSPSIDEYYDFKSKNQIALNIINENRSEIEKVLTFISKLNLNSLIINSAIAQDDEEELGSTESKISFTNRQYETLQTTDIWTLLVAGSGIAVGGALALSSLAAPMEDFQKAITSSLGIAIMATTQTVFSGLMAGYNFKQASDSKNNASAVQSIIDEFVNSVSSYCPDGREDLGNPMCYCYTEDNKRNPDRTNSQTCKDLWEQMDKSFYVPSSDYTSKQTEPKLCYTIEGKLDPNCECKKYISKSTGENACYKTSGISGFGASVGSGLNISPITSAINKMGQGDYYGADNIDTGSTLQNAAKARKALDQAIEQYNKYAKKNKKNGLPSADQIAMSQMRSMAPAIKQAITSPPSDQLINDNRPKGKKSDAIKKALDKLGTDGLSYTSSKKKAKKAKDEYDFVINEGAKRVKQVDETFNNAKYDYKDNDITKDESASIWDVISKRYNTSGLRRLFE